MVGRVFKIPLDAVFDLTSKLGYETSDTIAIAMVERIEALVEAVDRVGDLLIKLQT
jgi:hypothetical protein